MIISPTGLGMRNDSKGAGHFGAPRGNRKHAGYDFLCIPWQSVCCPIDDATIVRIARPYDDLEYSGAVIEAARITIKMFYFEVNANLIGKKVRQGEAIGHAQDISKRYGPSMRPHVHLEIIAIDPAVLLGNGRALTTNQ